MTMLDNEAPVDFRSPHYAPLFERLQGNILKSHGRNHTVNIFLELHRREGALRDAIAHLARHYVTSARDQMLAAEVYKRTGTGPLFGNLFLTHRAYAKLGLGDRLEEWFPDPPYKGGPPVNSRFRTGMRAAAEELDDELSAAQAVEPLETAYLRENIDAMLLLADDNVTRLSSEAQNAIHDLEREGVATVLAVETGQARRNARKQPIEHFGYIDGRSQPLFLASDFVDLAEDGRVDPDVTMERLRGGDGRVDVWNPFASLSLALLKDPGVQDTCACGSYYVFRKLEQNVRAFAAAERELADKLGLAGADRARAGAMLIGRFRDGTPLVLSETPLNERTSANNFRHDGLNARSARQADAPHDHLGLKCPFQAHVRKMNPRQSVDELTDGDAVVAEHDREARSHRIVRRGITYGTSHPLPDAVDDDIDLLPIGGVGLLFACFQSSIMSQFAFVQRRWANGIRFRVDGGASTPPGPDPIIGRRYGMNPIEHRWRARYGGPAYDDARPDPTELDRIRLGATHPVSFGLRSFVTFRGGEFFFAPSLPFLLGR